MKKERIAILILLLIGSILFPVVEHQTRAAIIGEVCLADPTIASGSPTPCPTAPPILAEPRSQQVRIGVFIQGSDALSGFDITLLANHTTLVPVGVNLAGTVLPGPQSVLLECLHGVITSGSVCSSTDTIDTLHYAVVAGSSALLTTPPTTGLLFSAIYNVTGNTSNSPITFQTGCSNTSVTGGICITVSGGAVNPVAETSQTAKFSNTAYFAVVPNIGTLQVPQGNADSTPFLLITSLNGFGGTSGATVNLSGSSTPGGPIVTISPNSVMLTAGAPGNQTLAGITVNVTKTVPAGDYTLAITGTSGTLSNSVTISLTVTQPDFSLIAAPSALTVQAGSSNSSIITVAGHAFFTGTILLSATVSAPGVTALVSPSNVTLSGAPSAATSKITIVASTATRLGNYPVTIIAESRTLSHSVTLMANVLSPSFVFIANPVTYLPSGSAVTWNIALRSVYNFSGTITLTTPVAPAGITATISPTSLNLASNSYATSTLTIATTLLTKPGVYAVTLTATNGTLSATTQILVNVVAPPAPDFVINAGRPVLTIWAGGSNATYSISLTSLYGFSGNVSLSAIVAPPGVNPPSAILAPAIVFLSPGGSSSFILLATASRLTPTGLYTLTLTANSTNGLISHSAFLILQVNHPLDLPPVADFTFTPSNPVVGQNVGFDGSKSLDPDGTVVSWAWSFGNGGFTTGEFVSTTYNVASNYTVTLTVTDNAGLSSSTSRTVSVIPQPAHDVSIVLLNPQPRTAVSTQTVFIQLQLANNGLNNENVSVTVYANGKPVQTLRGLFVQECTPNPFNFCGFRNYFTIAWDTSGITPGNYTISATVFLAPVEVDPTPSDNNLTNGIVTVLPPPTITVSPNNGPDGTKVLVQGKGFPSAAQYGYSYLGHIRVNFDNMTLGFTFLHNGTFTFTFDVPLSQAGPHGVFAYDENSGAHASSNFIVQSTLNDNLSVSIDMGTIYFPGDSAVAYILTTVNGTPVGPGNIQLQLVLFKPDGTNITLSASSIRTGLYKASYMISSTGPLGTYLVLAKAQASPREASSLVSFEVKLPWLSSNNGKITVGATTLAGVVGLVGLAWKKGFGRRKENEEAQPLPIL